MWSRVDPTNKVYVNFCPSLKFIDNGLNAAMVWQLCSNSYGIAQQTDYLPYVCEK